jgi:hypothetical protein
LSRNDENLRQHLDGNTELLGLDNGLRSVLTRRVEHGQETEKDPVTVVLLVSNTKRAETTASELSGLLLVEGSGNLVAVGKVDNGLRVKD